MAGLVPIQLGNVTNNHTGPLASSTDEPVTGFASFLSGFFNHGNGPKKPIEAVKLSDGAHFEPGNGCESMASAALKSSDLWPHNPEDGSDTPQSVAAKPTGSGEVNAGNAPEMPPLAAAKSFGSRLFHPIAGTPTTSPIGDRPEASTSNGAQVQQPGVVAAPGDDAGAAPVSLELDGNGRASPEDARSVTALLSEAGLVTAPGNTNDAGPDGEVTAPVLPAVTSGKNRDGGGGTPVRLHRLSDEALVPMGLTAVIQAVPDAATTPVGVAVQPPAGMVNMPTTVLPPLSDTVVATASDKVVVSPQQIKAGGGGAAETRRLAPVDPGKAQPDSADHPAAAVSPPAISLTAVEPEKFVARSDAVPAAPALTVRTEVSQTSPPGTAPSALSQTGQAQPAAPTDQIVPVLIGLLQKADGQQSVTVRLQPAELGQVQIRIDQTAAGASHINITAERPETLQLLQRDEPRLQQVLDQAGVLSTGRTVSFQVSPQAQIGATASRPDSTETGAGASGQGQNGGAWRQNGDAPNDFGRSPDPDQGQNRPRWFRAGLDITA